jgi:hypothetical protein
MVNRAQFARAIADLPLTHADWAIALLYYYNVSQEFEERSAVQLAGDLSEEGFPRPNVTRLRQDLRRDRRTIRGARTGTFRIDVRRVGELETRFSEHLQRRPIPPSDSLIPTTAVAGTRTYLERLVAEINVSYDLGLYDACAVLCRRLMESLILEVYISQSRHAAVQNNGVFVGLERLIGIICADRTLTLSRNTPAIMNDVKTVGDTAAHDRVYITQQRDIDDVKLRYRRMIDELLRVSGVRP